MIRAIVAAVLLLSCSFTAGADEGFSVDVVLKSTTSMSGDPITVPSGKDIAMQTHVVTINPGGEVGRHKHPYSVMMYVLEGTLEVQTDGGEARSYGPGEALIEDAETWVNNRNKGDVPVRFVAAVIVDDGTPGVIFPE